MKTNNINREWNQHFTPIITSTKNINHRNQHRTSTTKEHAKTRDTIRKQQKFDSTLTCIDTECVVCPIQCSRELLASFKGKIGTGKRQKSMFFVFLVRFWRPGGPGTLPKASCRPYASFPPNMSPWEGKGTRIGCIFIIFLMRPGHMGPGPTSQRAQGPGRRDMG